MNILLIGNIASGKGTLSEFLEKEYNIKHISTGDIFRNIVNENSKEANLVKSFIEKGQLVPDELTINLILNRLSQNDCKNGVILDGFPRTLSQAEAIKNKIKIDKVLFLDVEEEVLLKRLTSRISCPKCKKVYNKSWYNKDVCECGEKLTQRADDLDEKAIKERLSSFKNNTLPLLNYYKMLNLVSVIDGNTLPEKVNLQAKEVLDRV